ncbi:MAG: hypothetical protein ACYCZA_12730 [Thiobacillus sp.]
MSDSPMMSKMDALLKKHRGGGNNAEPVPSEPVATAEPSASPQPTAPPNAWLPVLTQVIERGTPPVVAAPVAVADATPPPQPQPEAPASALPAAEAPTPEPPKSDSSAPVINIALAEQLMNELAPRLSEVMEKQVASELRKNLDQTVATLLSQLDVNVREIVRNAIDEKLKQPHDPST